MIGLSNGSIELFKFDDSGIEPFFTNIANQIKIPEAGEIYSLAVVDLPYPAEKSPEIVLAF